MVEATDGKGVRQPTDGDRSCRIAHRCRAQPCAAEPVALWV